MIVLDGEEHVPFAIRRIYYISEVPPDRTRAGHAHRNLEEVLAALTGTFDVVIDDGIRRETVTMRQGQALYIPTFVWHELGNFSPGAVALGIASLSYDEHDNLRYDEFLQAVRRST